ncbi:MAG: peptide deformylase, peptide deformylase [Candidatus Dadabacteria bacterium CSP1-2]|jgi:peptide deformylase|nr:MAG: peptide deformylase, peptide deformylase [Candidatus Dadabacteria bacterium CSP1-2]MBF8302281.1 peptide deformylase [Candidatus Dadabacteria bacterium]
MASLPVLKYPHQILRTMSESVLKVDDGIRRIVNDMIETMYASPSCVGVAAPQVGYPLRIFVIDVSRKIGPKKNHGLLAMINPVLIYAEGEKITKEGCLSIPDFLGNVKRARNVIVRGLNPEGNEVEVLSQGLEAIAIQHEVDHLNGVLFIHRVSSLSSDLVRRKITYKDIKT